ncbi:MAG: hypothetical protein PHD51_01265 [Patescibacteria group bacterium]|nr:hypothetical protein [Patescibacteria group bacterium]MDD5490511.1 hypothetical protein [Patescibacteria group bacterium]
MCTKLVQKPMWGGLLSAIVTLLYCALMAFFMNWMGKNVAGDSILNIVLVLGLLVFSVSVCGVLVFGIPAYLFFKKDVKEGFIYLGHTMIWMFLLVLILVMAILLI